MNHFVITIIQSLDLIPLNKKDGDMEECEGCADFPTCLYIKTEIKSSELCPCKVCLIKGMCNTPYQELAKHYIENRTPEFHAFNVIKI